MFSEPDDPAVRVRMHTAFTNGKAMLGCRPETGVGHRLGHSGMTLGGPVDCTSGRAWLRVMEVCQRNVILNPGAERESGPTC